MNFLSTLEKIETSNSFKQFKKKHSDAKLCAGFFVLDYQQGKNQQQLDYILKNNKIFTFIANGEITIKEAETMDTKEKLPAIKKDIKVDLDDVEKIVEEKMKNEKIKKKIVKTIAVLQKHEGKEIWNLNCMLSGLGILQVHIDCENGEIIKFERKNLFDFIKRVK
jgi:hypothetical protein